MNIVGILIGLVVAIVFYIVATAVIVFPHSVLVFGLVALLIFLALAFGNVNYRGRL